MLFGNFWRKKLGHILCQHQVTLATFYANIRSHWPLWLSLETVPNHRVLQNVEIRFNDYVVVVVSVVVLNVERRLKWPLGFHSRQVKSKPDLGKEKGTRQNGRGWPMAMWLSWERGHFQYRRFGVHIQSLATLYGIITVFRRKDENKKRPGKTQFHNQQTENTHLLFMLSNL